MPGLSARRIVRCENVCGWENFEKIYISDSTVLLCSFLRLENGLKSCRQEALQLAHIPGKDLYEVEASLGLRGKLHAFWQRAKFIEIARRRVDDYGSLITFQLEFFEK